VGVECGSAPNLPNCSCGLARLMLPTMTMAYICAVFYLRHPCQQPYTLLQPYTLSQPASQNHCLLDVLCWLGALCTDEAMLSSNSSASHSRTQTITGHLGMLPNRTHIRCHKVGTHNYRTMHATKQPPPYMPTSFISAISKSSPASMRFIRYRDPENQF
jgi:hypothetical protein